MIDPPEKRLTGRILVVDDSRIHLKNLSGILQREGHECLLARSGREALQKVQSEKPEIILLDLLMPDMTGYETCQRLREIPGAVQIPVLFMTGLNDAESKVQGFDAGAVDYITKPFEEGELLARVRTHLGITRLRSELDAEIADKDRAIVELDAFSHTVAHDLKNPLSGMIGMADALLEEVEGEPKEMARDIYEAGLACLRIVEEILLLASVRGDAVKLETVDPRQTLQEALANQQWKIDERRAIVEIDGDFPKALGRGGWIVHVWMNFISNAINYGGDPPLVRIEGKIDGNWGEFSVIDNGPGISPEKREELFVPFTRLGQVNVKGSGLGLSIVRRIMDRLEGEAGMEPAPQGGCRFYFRLPLV